jgi:hypothetical protein
VVPVVAQDLLMVLMDDREGRRDQGEDLEVRVDDREEMVDVTAEDAVAVNFLLNSDKKSLIFDV